jgi:dihydroxyacetone kinase-like predicted kinase
VQLKLNKIAKEMIEKGFKSTDLDKNAFVDAIIEMLDGRELFTLISEEMEILEDENHPEPKDLESYLERMGEV